jgi:hypothetical protein
MILNVKGMNKTVTVIRTLNYLLQVQINLANRRLLHKYA